MSFICRREGVADLEVEVEVEVVVVVVVCCVLFCGAVGGSVGSFEGEGGGGVGGVGGGEEVDEGDSIVMFTIDALAGAFTASPPLPVFHQLHQCMHLLDLL